MITDTLIKLLDVVQRKNHFDQHSVWSDGSSTYLAEIRSELIEVEEEIPLDRLCYLEDELGDVLWDYLNILVCLENEKGIDAANVFKRCLVKFDERVTGLEKGTLWAETKRKQKQALLEEYHRESKPNES